MAQKVILVDDFDNSEPAETVTFAVEGVQYEVDLGPVNRDELLAALQPYIEVGRRVGGRRRNGSAAAAAVAEPAKRSTRRKKSSSGSKKSAASKENAAIRAWASENNVEVPERGRIPAHVREQYTAATAS